MKKLIILTAIFFSGCALFPSTFDSQEHAKLVHLHVFSKDSSVCKDREVAGTMAEILARDAEWVWHYGSTLPDNDKMAAMEKNLMDMTKEFSDRYKRSEPVSVLYCRNKFENIHQATDTMMKVSARRPR